LQSVQQGLIRVIGTDAIPAIATGLIGLFVMAIWGFADCAPAGQSSAEVAEVVVLAGLATLAGSSTIRHCLEFQHQVEYFRGCDTSR